jgi:hypothetical protein
MAAEYTTQLSQITLSWLRLPSVAQGPKHVILCLLHIHMYMIVHEYINIIEHHTTCTTRCLHTASLHHSPPGHLSIFVATLLTGNHSLTCVPLRMLHPQQKRLASFRFPSLLFVRHAKI